MECSNSSGLVLEVKEDKAIVEIKRNSACDACGACSHAHETKLMKVEALNIAGAKKGDLVEINLKTPDFLRATLIMYGIPFIFLIIGVFAFKYIFNSDDIKSAIAGLVFTAISYFFIKIFEPKIKNNEKYKPVILKIQGKTLKGFENL